MELQHALGSRTSFRNGDCDVVFHVVTIPAIMDGDVAAQIVSQPAVVLGTLPWIAEGLGRSINCLDHRFSCGVVRMQVRVILARLPVIGALDLVKISRVVDAEDSVLV